MTITTRRSLRQCLNEAFARLARLDLNDLSLSQKNEQHRATLEGAVLQAQTLKVLMEIRAELRRLRAEARCAPAEPFPEPPLLERERAVNTGD